MFPTWTDGGRRKLGHRCASARVLRRHWLHFSSAGCPQWLQFQQGGFFADYHWLSVISRRRADMYRAPRTWRRQRLGYKSTQSQHGNGVADSLPSGSGNLDVYLGRQWLPLAYPMQTLKPVQDPIDLTALVRLIAYWYFSSSPRLARQHIRNSAEAKHQTS
jgi:hypothetical protein